MTSGARQALFGAAVVALVLIGLVLQLRVRYDFWELEERPALEAAESAAVLGSADAASDVSAAVFDADNDGDDDELRLADGGLQLWLNDGSRLQPLDERFAGAPSSLQDVRSVSIADLNQDGRLDLAVTKSDGSPVVLWNRFQPRRWLRLKLEARAAGAVTPAPDSPGASVEVVAGGRRQRRLLPGGGGGPTTGAATLHFGLGESGRAESVRIVWPSGNVDEHRDVSADREYLAAEGRAELSAPRPATRRAGT